MTWRLKLGIEIEPVIDIEIEIETGTSCQIVILHIGAVTTVLRPCFRQVNHSLESETVASAVDVDMGSFYVEKHGPFRCLACSTVRGVRGLLICDMR